MSGQVGQVVDDGPIRIPCEWTPQVLCDALHFEATMIERSIGPGQKPTARLTLSHGLWFTPAIGRYGDLPWGEPKQCFRNSLLWAMLQPDRFIYCEGYAVGIIPIHHGWLIDRVTRAVVDLTWRERRFVYVGLPFRSEFLFHCYERDNRSIGNILGDYDLNFPAERGLYDWQSILHRPDELPPGVLLPETPTPKTVDAQALDRFVRSTLERNGDG